MTSIPFDPGLVLGNIVEMTRIAELEEVAELQEPINVANDKLNSLILSQYKMYEEKGMFSWNTEILKSHLLQG